MEINTTSSRRPASASVRNEAVGPLIGCLYTVAAGQGEPPNRRWPQAAWWPQLAHRLRLDTAETRPSSVLARRSKLAQAGRIRRPGRSRDSRAGDCRSDRGGS